MKLAAEIAALRAEIAALRADVARLKRLVPDPIIPYDYRALHPSAGGFVWPTLTA